ncbi:LOW QUALITY PROTEIN: uncharacterized protein LOC117314720 [Pecten maximus]|uniref:LOW QUALITY PROTEIN: uncharacterized protein LOC117314720 n=1 Tax=Pecten maximus TaxID=6579 RepID=UPI0014585D3D|nr:LOW QUALITY PROTEIN: uncharacterized protein LOC117314720 [Pecten maximus]
MSIPDAWTSDRVDFNGKARVVKLVTGIKDVGAAKVKNLSKSNTSSTHASHKSRSQKALQLKAKHFSDKPVVRTSHQDDRPLTTKPPIFPGAYFMPSENPTATLLTQMTVGTNRLTDSQADYLESVQTNSSSTPRGVPMVDIGCGGFLSSGITNDITMTKRAFISESQSRERKQTALRKSQSMAVRPNANVEQNSKPQTLFNNSNDAPPRQAPSGKSLCYHESFKRGGDLLPVYDKSELDTCNDQIDLLLPGVVSEATPRRSGQSGSAVNSRTPNCCSCCSMCDGPGDFRFLVPGATPTLNRKSSTSWENNGMFGAPQQQCECRQCHEENGLPPKKLVQYRHGDVIKTFDWLTSDSQETAL